MKSVYSLENQKLLMTQTSQETAEKILSVLQGRSIVLVGMMGSGKSSIGRRLAQVFNIPFVDCDHEMEKENGMSIAAMFDRFGEPAFRDAERRATIRMLEDGPKVVATGGGAFMNEQTRTAIAQKGISIWLKASLDVLMERVRRRSHRPLLQTEDPETVMRALLEKRESTYSLADITIESGEGSPEGMVYKLIDHLDAWLKNENPR